MYRATNRRSRAGSVTAASLPPPRLQIPDEPPKVPRRPPSKGNKRETLGDIAKRIPVQLMRQYFNYPLRAAAEAMHISVTTLKRLCRRHGVKRWPHRQISGINRALTDLEAQHDVAEGGEMLTVTEQLCQLHRRREVIIELAFESEDESSASKGGFDAAPPAAHKRGKRGNITHSNDGISSSSSSSGSSAFSSSSSSSCSSAPSSPSHSRSASFASLASLPESKPQPGLGLGAWWKNPSGVDIGFAAAAALAETENIIFNGGAIISSSSSSSTGSTSSSGSDSNNKGSGGGGGKRPRRPSGGGGGPGKAKVQRKPKSSAIFGTIVPSSRATGAEVATTGTAGPRTTTTAKHVRKSSSTSSGGAYPTRAIKIDSHPISAPGSPAPAPEPTPTPVPVPASASGSDSGAGDGDGGASGSPLTASGASLASELTSSSSGNIFGLGPQGNQQVDDLSVLGDLLFGPDEAAAAAAAAAGTRAQSLLAAHLNPGVFSYSAGAQWGAQGPCVPLCPQGVFSQESSLLSPSTPSTFSSYEQGFSAGVASAANWSGAIAGDANGWNGVGPLAL